MNRKLFRFFLLLAFIISQYLIVIYTIQNIPGRYSRIDIISDVAKYANPLIGTANDGHVFPGPCLPFGVVKVGFDTDDKSDFNGGYTTRGRITGISHLHVSGTGGKKKK